jgi:hypothetical protein
MKYHIYPPIGIARVGNSPTEFFIGPERIGHPGVEFQGGNEVTVSKYKDANLRIKRQGARFHLFEDAEDGTPLRPAQLPAGAKIEWTAHVVNRKNAVVRGGGPPANPGRPTPSGNAAASTIDAGAKTVSGAQAAPVKFEGGKFRGRDVPLGECFTDAAQRLVVLGGRGFSSSVVNPPNIGSFYNNPDWHDDTSDGPITAKVLIPGQAAVNATPAWVIVATPDFAPEIQGVVTLYDILFQVGLGFGLTAPANPSFTNDIFPIIRRTANLRWVNSDPTWTDVSEDWAKLSQTNAANQQLRTDTRDVVLGIEGALSRYRLTATQKSMLDKWVAGNFAPDWQGIPAPSNAVTPAGLTRAALDGTVGQGFFPGIEAGIILRDPTLYANPFDFRLRDPNLKPGDLTALMAVPWQADFWECARNWWPSQRPDDVRISANSTNTDAWDKGITSGLSLVRDFGKLGFVTPVTNGGQTVYIQTERDPNFV